MSLSSKLLSSNHGLRQLAKIFALKNRHILNSIPPEVCQERFFATMSVSHPNSTLDSNERASVSKRVLFLRHGQAVHNPRAEAARSQGCSYETFMDLMKQDDAFDADLTPLGEEQAIQGRAKYESELEGVELVVSSPLTRTLKTV